MEENAILLHSSTNAIAGSEEAVHLIKQKERLEHALIQKDASLVLDLSKAFLESVFKTILSDRLDAPNLNQDMNSLFSFVREQIPLNTDAQANEILKRLTNSVVDNIAKLRNKYGAASHGDDGYFDNPIGMTEASMCAYFADALVAFIYSKHKELNDPEVASRIYYQNYPDFNDYLDGQYEGYSLQLGDKYGINLSASELIFTNECKLYREMLLQYRSSQKDNEEE